MRRLHPVLAGGPLLIAHRGGSGLAPENTLFAFQSAAHDWAADMIEFDVHATRDGHCVIIHDDTVDRTTNGTGAVADKTLDELRELDAGYHFTRDGGLTFPFRGRGISISTLEEVLEALPRMRMTIEVKAGAAQRRMLDAIRQFNATERVIAAGMFDRDRTLFGEYPGMISASNEQAKRIYTMHRLRLLPLYPVSPNVVQIPEWWEGRCVVNARLVRELRRKNIPVHVWTVNDAESMDRLLEIGVDGLVTDRPDIASQLLQQRVGRPPAPIER